MENTPNTDAMLPLNHLLARGRPTPRSARPTSSPTAIDTTTLAAHDFDVDVRSGFMPPEPPIPRLPQQWEVWEQILDEAIQLGLRIGDRIDGNPPESVEKAAWWRESVCSMKLLPTEQLASSERLLRRAHLVLAFILHFYVQSHPPGNTPIVIPPSLTEPLHTVSTHLVLPLVLTYADTVLYNWKRTEEGIRSVTLFTKTKDEEHFFLTSAYIELGGVEALSFMQKCMDEAFVADGLALRRITHYLRSLAVVIKRLTEILDAVRDHCDPKTFYHDIRPWFKGEDSGNRQWIFIRADGSELAFGERRELSGPSAGQSSLIHALDIFLGVDHSQKSPHHAKPNDPPTKPTNTLNSKSHDSGFLDRMQSYMPRHHRAFLIHLKRSPRPIRSLVSRADPGSPLVIAYNSAVLALKGFRDAHIRIATLYIINQARGDLKGEQSSPIPQAKGTGGTNLIPFLKSSRNDTAKTVLLTQK